MEFYTRFVKVFTLRNVFCVRFDIGKRAAMVDRMGDYPTDDELEIIVRWQANDLHGLMEYIRPLWRYSDCGYWERIGDEYHISTGGWSGNEDIIRAMGENIIWWVLYWQSSRRGGHYVFSKLELG